MTQEMQTRQRFVIVFRHGESDSQTGLTTCGEDQVQYAAKVLQESGLIPDRIVASYPLRAQKTAEILRRVFSVATTPEDTRDLLNVFQDFDVEACIAPLNAQERILLLAGHAETLSYFAHYFLDDQGYERLFSMLDSDCEKGLYLPNPADALIFCKDQESSEWSLHGIIHDGKLSKANNIKTIHRGKKNQSPYVIGFTPD